MKLKVDHAVVDVKTGRGLLRRSLKKHGAVAVVVYGTLVGEHSGDDGESQEFRMEVTKCVVAPNEEWMKQNCSPPSDDRPRTLKK